jgi:hypothetical protein
MNLRETFKTIALIALAGAFVLGMNGKGIPISLPVNIGHSGGAAASQGKVDVPNSPYFKSLDFYNMQSSGTLTLLSHYKTYQQTMDYTCGPAAALTVVEHFKGAPLDDEMAIAKIMGTGLPESSHPGTTVTGMNTYFKKIGWTVHSSVTDPGMTPKDMDDFKKFVLENLQRNVPIMVENVDWGGHWRVIIGYDTLGDKEEDNDVLIMADPSDTTDHKQDGYNIVPASRFFHMWFDDHLFPQQERMKPWLTAEPPKAQN